MYHLLSEFNMDWYLSGGENGYLVRICLRPAYYSINKMLSLIIYAGYEGGNIAGKNT